MFKCVPFDPGWVNNDKLDLKAIYRRPATDAHTRAILRDAAGSPKWDYSALPVRRHQDWLKKGYEYVTLADYGSLSQAASSLRAKGLNPADYIMQTIPERSPWNAAAYLAEQATAATSAIAELKAVVAEYGIEAVTKIKRQEDPAWQPPAELAGMKGKAK